MIDFAVECRQKEAEEAACKEDAKVEVGKPSLPLLDEANQQEYFELIDMGYR